MSETSDSNLYSTKELNGLLREDLQKNALESSKNTFFKVSEQETSFEETVEVQEKNYRYFSSIRTIEAIDLGTYCSSKSLEEHRKFLRSDA